MLLPITGWISSYTRKDFAGDLTAGITVGVMLIPQGMAYALLAGVPPVYGLYASLVPLLVFPLFTSSRHLAVGIMAIDCLIVSAGLGVLEKPFSAEYLGLAVILTLMTGVIQLVLGMLRFGFVVNLLSRPVIQGFTAAAALTIAFSQFRDLLGIPDMHSSGVLRVILDLVTTVSHAHLPTVAIGIGGIALLIGIRRYYPRLPAPLGAVFIGTLLVWGLKLNQAGVSIVGTIPAGLPAFQIPSLSGETVNALLPTAVTLALLQFMTVISLGKVFAMKHRYGIEANREMIALGAMNLAGSFFRSLPVSGSFSRSAVTDQSGGRSPLANTIAASVIGLTLLFLTPLFYYLPIPVFSAIIIVSASRLVDLRELRFLLRTKRIDGLLSLATFLATLFIGIHQGVLIGIGLSVLVMLYQVSRPRAAILGRIPGTDSFRDLAFHADAVPIENVFILRVDSRLGFTNAEYIRDLILKRLREKPAEAVILDASAMNDLDTTALVVLQEVFEALEINQIDLRFASAKEPVYRVLVESGLYESIGSSHFYLTIADALTGVPAPTAGIPVLT